MMMTQRSYGGRPHCQIGPRNPERQERLELVLELSLKLALELVIVRQPT